MSIADWWGKYHQTESDPEKIKVFKKHEKLFDTYQNEDLMGLGDIDIEEVQPSDDDRS
jgi:hypothetical protein